MTQIIMDPIIIVAEQKISFDNNSNFNYCNW